MDPGAFDLLLKKIVTESIMCDNATIHNVMSFGSRAQELACSLLALYESGTPVAFVRMVHFLLFRAFNLKDYFVTLNIPGEQINEFIKCPINLAVEISSLLQFA